MNELDRMKRLAGILTEGVITRQEDHFDTAFNVFSTRLHDLLSSGVDQQEAMDVVQQEMDQEGIEADTQDQIIDMLNNNSSHSEIDEAPFDLDTHGESIDDNVVAQKMERLAQMSGAMMDQDEALVAISRELQDEGYGNDEIASIMDAIEHKLHSDFEREEFLNGEEEEDYDDNEICVSCNGSGEGQYDGTRCSSCGGSGVDRSAQDDDDFDPPEEDFDDYYEEVSMEEDLNNGYEDVHYAKGSDYFPNGADSPTSQKAGPAAAKAGNNPEAQAMEIRETHKELVYNYRQFIKESASKK